MAKVKHSHTSKVSQNLSKLEKSGLRSTITYNTTGHISDSFKLHSYHSTRNLIPKDEDDPTTLHEENKFLKSQVEELKMLLKREKADKH